MLAHAKPTLDWPGYWFHEHLVRRQLYPVCRVAYERVALVGRSSEGPLRLTLDRNIRGVFAREWSFDALDGGFPFLTNQVICEFKYQSFLPSLFKEIIQSMCLTPSPVSKYREFLRVYGNIGDREAIDA